MRSLKTFQGILWLLYQFLFLLDEVKGGAKRDFFDCATVHICECGLAEEYNKCYLLAPDEVKENAIALYAEYFPGEYTLDEGMKPCILELCKNKGDDTAFEIYSKIDIQMRQYEREVQNNPLKAKEKMQMHYGKVCATPLIAKCVEFGNKCG
ncbi:hypothetical protein TNCT_265811 [Trichonephila clavata]|uniref:Uncharacterized protein n=1 Tax=Trichonephila clavata TaxID=2740835 RepID=A0A8X6F648_TRICU|nr:hypothetical protein TNCT_265811 [Trichonephila clavata]